MNTPCIHCDAGCTIHDTKPAECSDFECAYAQAPHIGEDLRPDKCGIVFEKLSDNIFYGTVVTGMKISEQAKGQIQSFLAQGYSVVLAASNEQTNHFMISQNHDESSIRQEFSEVVHGHLLH